MDDSSPTTADTAARQPILMNNSDSNAEASIDTEKLMKSQNFIPLRLPDLRDRLIKMHPQFFEHGSKGEERTRLFRTLCQRLQVRNNLRINEEFGNLSEEYCFFDPDTDVLPVATGGWEQAQQELDAKGQMVERELDEVFEMGGFERMPKELERESTKMQSVTNGLDVSAPPPGLRYKFYYRGLRRKQVEVRNLRTMYRKKLVNTHIILRLALLFQFNAEEQEAACCRHWVRRRAPKIESLPENHRSEFMYMKLFKNVDLADLDMLLPGTKVQFTIWDNLIIWGPIVAGIIMAVYKAVEGTFDFSSLTSAMTSLLLVVFPLTYGFKAYTQVKEKAEDYEAHLNEVFLMKNLANNNGVMAAVLDEAVEQENLELVLAYFFLWQGLGVPEWRRKEQLDAAVEEWLNAMMAQHNLNARIDFEVQDAIGDMERMGLLATDAAKGLKVVPLDRAVELLHWQHFDPAEVHGGQSKKAKAKAKAQQRQQQPDSRAAAGPRPGPGLPVPPGQWYECYAMRPGTKQTIRYFFNPATGQSTYDEPAAFVKQGNGGLAMQPMPRPTNAAAGQLPPQPSAPGTQKVVPWQPVPVDKP